MPRSKLSGPNTEVVLDANLDVVTLKGREAVSEDPEGHSLPWYPKPALRTALLQDSCTHSRAFVRCLFLPTEEPFCRSAAGAEPGSWSW